MSGAKANHFQGSFVRAEACTLQGSDLLSTSAVAARRARLLVLASAKAQATSFCFVSGLDFSHATPGQNGQGFRVCVRTPEFGKPKGAPQIPRLRSG